MPFKDFQAGDILTASDVDTYLMNQSVMYFSSASARNTAIASPTTGMCAVIGAGGQLTYNNGSGWIDLAWASTVAWTPTYSATITQGTGPTSSATYTRLGNIVIAQLNFTFGTGGAVTGAMEFSLPVAYTSAARFSGTVRMTIGANTYFGSVIANAGNARIYAMNTAATYASATLTAAAVPSTWAAGSTFTAQVIYEV